MTRRDAPRRVSALLLAAGAGERLRPLTDTTPKCLVRVGERPLLDRWLDALADAGVSHVRINTHHLADVVRAHLAERQDAWPFGLVESHEPVLLGSAGTVRANRDLAEDADDLLVVYADNVSTLDLVALLDFHRMHEDPVTMAVFRAADPSACGIVGLDSAGRVVSFTEKPERPASDLANAGVYVLSPDAYRDIADLDAVDLGHDVLPRFVSRMRAFVWNGYHVDVGTPDALARARRDVTRWDAGDGA